MPTTPTIQLLNRGPITIESALEEEENIINRASYGPATEKLYQHIWHQRSLVEDLVRHHMGLGTQVKCVVLPPDQWIRGGFNVCVIVQVSTSDQKIIFRCPMAAFDLCRSQNTPTPCRQKRKSGTDCFGCSWKVAEGGAVYKCLAKYT